jgi:hypothetical protein
MTCCVKRIGAAACAVGGRDTGKENKILSAFQAQDNQQVCGRANSRCMVKKKKRESAARLYPLSQCCSTAHEAISCFSPCDTLLARASHVPDGHLLSAACRLQHAGIALGQHSCIPPSCAQGHAAAAPRAQGRPPDTAPGYKPGEAVRCCTRAPALTQQPHTFRCW